MSRVLLVSPAFHGYWRAIGLALRARGHETACVRYDDARGPLAALRRRALARAAGLLPGAERLSQSGPRAIAALRAWRPEAVVVVKGDELGEAWWDALDASGAKRVTWFYDELERMRYDERTLAHIGPVASYSPRDAERLGVGGRAAAHLPLAHDHRTPAAPLAPRPEVSFIGARYPNRERLLAELDARLAQRCGREAPEVRAYGRDWSPALADRIRSGHRSPSPVAASPGVDRARGYGIMAASLATLNLHGEQDGYTMRTFEACGSGAVQLIDRRIPPELYEPGEELLCVRDAEEAAEAVERLRARPALADRIRARARARTLAEHTFDHRVAVLEEMWA